MTIYTEIKHVFPAQSLEQVLIISTMQRTSIELASYGDQADIEKDRCLERVNTFWIVNHIHVLLCVSLWK